MYINPEVAAPLPHSSPTMCVSLRSSLGSRLWPPKCEDFPWPGPTDRARGHGPGSKPMTGSRGLGEPGRERRTGTLHSPAELQTAQGPALGRFKAVLPTSMPESKQMSEGRPSFTKSLLLICLLSVKGVGKALIPEVQTTFMRFACSASPSLAGARRGFSCGELALCQVVLAGECRPHPMYRGGHMTQAGQSGTFIPCHCDL